MRGDIEVETLLKIILVLILVWVVLETVDLVFDILGALLAPFTSIIGLIIAALIVLWLLDRI
jgi:hypothetical protein